MPVEKIDESQESLPRIRKAVSEGAPSRRISANSKPLLGKGFAFGKKHLDLPTVSQTFVSSPNAPLTYRLPPGSIVT
jgi:hypothetical protein